jgi:hypothetical protein
MSASVIDVSTVRVLDKTNESDVAELLKLGKLLKDFNANYMGRIREDVSNEAVIPSEDDGIPI